MDHVCVRRRQRLPLHLRDGQFLRLQRVVRRLRPDVIDDFRGGVFDHGKHAPDQLLPKIRQVAAARDGVQIAFTELEVPPQALRAVARVRESPCAEQFLDFGVSQVLHHFHVFFDGGLTLRGVEGCESSAVWERYEQSDDMQ